MNIKFLIVLASILILISCDSGNNNNKSCDEFQIAFSPIPECVTEYFLENPTTCLCDGEDGEFRLTLLFFEAEGNTGTFMGNKISWEPLDCLSLSFMGETSGVLENMIVPDEGLLNFTMILDSSEPVQISCCCNDLIIVE